MDQTVNSSQRLTSQPPISSPPEVDIFDIIIKISIPVIIVFIVVIIIITKPWTYFNISFPSFNSTNQTSQELSSFVKYIEISDPVYTLTGTISQIDNNIITLQITTSTDQTDVPISVSDSVSIAQIQQSDLTSNIPPTPEKVALQKLQKGERLVVTTKDDIRYYSGKPLVASSITILNNITNGTVDSVDNNTVNIITDSGAKKQIIISDTTKIILSDYQHSVKIHANSIVPRDSVMIISNLPSAASSKISAIEITVTPPVMGKIIEITSNSLTIERKINENNLSVITSDATTYTLYSANQNNIDRSQIQIGDIVAIDTPDFDPNLSTATGQNIRVYRP